MRINANSAISIFITLALFSGMANAKALNTVTITSSVMSPNCIDYRVTGICYWLFCTPYGCKVRTSVKIRHYIPDAVVSSYQNTGQNPWSEMSFLGTPISGAQSGGRAITSQSNESQIATFLNSDVIGHPGQAIYNRFVSQFGYTCPGATQPFTPYFVSTLDSLGWRQNVPEMVYPESLIPGMREIGSTLSANLWGNVYPRGGFTHQSDDYKAAATIAQRAGDIVTRRGQPHVYMPMLANKHDGYIPPGELIESDKSTGKWQELAPKISQTCKTFPDNEISHQQATDSGFAWALWRPYGCCKRQGQTFLGSVDFN